MFTRGRGLTFTSARVLGRARIDGQARNRATQRIIVCVVRALMPTLAALPPHVCHRRETGLSPMARAHAGRGYFLGASHIQAHRFL